MINLFALKREKKENNASTSAASQSKNLCAAQIRVQKDISDLLLPKMCRTVFPNSDDLLNFKIIISPDEGFYRGGEFVFNFHIERSYPHAPPKVKCESKIYHPNIDHEGNVCLNILRADWNPVLTINSVVYGLISLLLEPNPEDALNQEAADILKQGPVQFKRKLAKNMRNRP